MDARPHTENPLGLNLDFLYGRGYLWAQGEHVSDWVTLERLRMEIPDLKFPFDVRGGLTRFRDTRCLVRELELVVSEVGLAELIRNASAQMDGFGDVEVRFQDGGAVVGMRLGAFGNDAFVTFRVAAVRPEPAASDVVELSLFDYRAYGPLPCPARALGHEFLSRFLQTDAVTASGAAGAFELEGDVLRVRPLKLLLLHIFAGYGWKLPNLTNVALQEVRVGPGGAVIAAHAIDDKPTSGAGKVSGMLTRALAAHDAKGLFSSGDEALFAERPKQAVKIYQSLQERYRGSAELASRLLDVLLADPTPANLAEADTVCRELEEREPASLTAAVSRARMALLRERDVEAALETLADLLATRGDTLDRAYCEVILARQRLATDPHRAAARLSAALRAEPRNRPGLELLREIYEKTDRRADLEDVLKRLTGVAPSAQSLVDTYLALAKHLLEKQNEPAEARVFLERALRADPKRFDVLDALGASWVRTGEPARGIKALSSAARAAEERQDPAMASRLHHRISRLWHDSLGEPEQALLEIRRAIDQWESSRVEDPLEIAEQLRYAAFLCDRGRQHSEAIAYWTEALAALQLAEARVQGEERVEVRRQLADTHRDVAAAYRARGRVDVAINHERRLLEMDPTDLEAIDALESHYRSQDAMGRLVRIIEETVERIGPHPESLAMRLRLADLYIEVGRKADSIDTLEVALGVAPGSETARRSIAARLVESGEPERLRDVLTALRHRVQQRDVQWSIAVELGDLCIDVLDDPDGAARAYRDATEILPARREAYVWCRFVLERLAHDIGWDGDSPLGGTIGSSLLDLWQSLADRVGSDERISMLDEIAKLAVAMGRESRAREAHDLRTALLTEPEAPLSRTSSQDEGMSLSENSDWLHAQTGSALEKEHSFARTERTKLVHNAATPDPNETQAPWKSAPPTFDQAAIETQEVDRFPSFPRDESEKQEDTLAADSWDDIVDFPSLRTWGEERTEAPTVEPEIAREEPATAVGPSLRALLAARAPESPPRPAELNAEVEQFRRKLEDTTRKPPSLADLSDPPEHGPLARILRRPRGPQPVVEQPVELEAPAPEVDVAALKEAVGRARKSGEPDEIANALSGYLAEAPGLSDDERLELSYELGELYYYELEDNQRALPLLQRVRELDPDGYGARPGVLNAIEAIYSEEGSIEGQIEILRTKMERAESKDMADTYRLLLAQLEWESRADAARARAWLDPVLERDERHEGAHRLLADIAEDTEEWRRAADHLELALSVAGDGLDSLELERRLATLLLHRLEEAERAAELFTHLLKSAPGDQAAMASLRECQAAQGDWESYTDGLLEELRLLLGQTFSGANAASDWVEGLEPDEIARPLRTTASQILADVARARQEHLGDDEGASLLWGKAIALWPENVEAVERRIDLDRKLNDDEALAADLERYAAMLLDASARFDVLFEAARLHAEVRQDIDKAHTLLDEALQAAAELSQPPAGVEDARETLRTLEKRRNL